MVYCDHKSLSLSLCANPKAQHRKIAAWMDEMQQYGVKVVYTKGKNQEMADWLSRPVAEWLCKLEQGG